MSPKKEQIQQAREQQEADIVQCLKVLSNGGLILYPTDTVWGIGCDATNAEAVKRVFELKQRDDSKALIVLLDSADHLDHYVVDVPAIVEGVDYAVTWRRDDTSAREPSNIILLSRDGTFRIIR